MGECQCKTTNGASEPTRNSAAVLSEMHENNNERGVYKNISKLLNEKVDNYKMIYFLNIYFFIAVLVKSAVEILVMNISGYFENVSMIISA